MWLASGSYQGKLVLALILAVSLGPVVQGLECYFCSSDKNAPEYEANCGRKDPRRVVKCSNDAIGCVFRTEENGRFVKRECAEFTYPLCVDDAFNMELQNGKCATNKNVTKENWETFKGCDHRERNLEFAEEESIGDIAPGEVAEAPKKGRQSIEVCFCKSNRCNSNAIQPKSALSTGASGVGNVKAGIAVTVLASILGLVLGSIQ